MSDFFEGLRKWTPARIGLKRAGSSLSTSEILKFKLAHAQARDAVHAEWDSHSLHTELEKRRVQNLVLRSGVSSKHEYLKRPDLGRVLHPSSIEALRDLKENSKTSNSASSYPEIVFVVSDGLSATAVEKHFLPFWNYFESKMRELRITFAPVILVPFSRVAIADSIGEALSAQVSVVFIGERPGLSTVDSLGVYLTYQPRAGVQDSQRNCISNIRPPEGLSYEKATSILLFLLKESLRLKISGVNLKDESALIS